MTDYDWSIGSSGTMRIRDTGTYVEFWINSNNSTTFAHELPWGYTVNGVTDNSNSYDYNAGAGWERLGRWNVTYDQTVTFRLFDTGTSGFGSGETHSVAIQRATVPPAPTIVTLTPSETTMYVDMNSNGTGGATVDRWQLGWSTSSSAPSSYMDLNLSNGTGTVTGLVRGTTYYFWARGHNSKGWGAWSARKSATTWTVPTAPSAPVASNISQFSATVKTTPNATGGTAILEYQFGFGLTSGVVDTWLSSGLTTTLDVAGLSPGKTYYVVARARNAVGWSNNSVQTTVKLVAGAKVRVGGVIKDAVPWVKVAGVWKVARPWVNSGGTWKTTL